MESPTPFDLNQAIQCWRESLAQSPAIRGENLDELEAHLRDSVALLETRGLTSHEAFVVAANRVGRRASLEVEFGKVNGKSVWLDRVLWMLIGIQVWGLASSLTGNVASIAMAYGLRNTRRSFEPAGMALPVMAFALAQLAAVAASVALCWWLLVSKGGKFSAWLEHRLQRRFAVATCCIVLSLPSFLLYAFNFGFNFFLARSTALEHLGQTSRYSSYSYFIVWPIRVVTMMAFTLLLARKRFRLKEA